MQLRFLVVLLLLLAAAAAASGGIIRVPEDQATIQAGIAAAVEGDTVIVSDGTFSGDGNRDIDFGGKGLLLQSENGAGNATIDAGGVARGFHFVSGETGASIVEGFTITNGYAGAQGGGIYCYQASPSIIDCVIAENASGDCGGGMCLNSSTPWISRCVIRDNDANLNGGGIYFSDGSPAEVDQTDITFNYAWSGGGITCNYTSPTLINCFITCNTAGYVGGGVQCHESDAILTHCTIYLNMSETEGGGLRCDSSDPVLTNCILWGSTPDEIWLYDSDPVITYSDINGGWSGAGNIDQNPDFLGDLDFHLEPGSPCVDAGKNAGVQVDFEGDVRPQGAGYDMGADENLPENTILNAVASDGLIEENGIDSDDYVLVAFFQPTTKPEITAENIDEILPLSDGHTWRDWSGELGAADWNMLGDQLYILLSVHPMGLPTVASGDTIRPFIPLVRTKKVVITGSFDPDASVTGGESPSPRTGLLPCSPNPFNPSTLIGFTLDSAGPVKITIFDISGRLVVTLADGDFEAGRHSVRWNGCNSARAQAGSGVYICRMEAGGASDTSTLVLVK